MEAMNDILYLHDAEIGFQNKNETVKLLEGIDLRVRTGELTCLLGRNGAGKSTLLKCIVRIMDMLRGEILLDGKDIRKIHPNEFAKELAYVSSGFQHSDTMSVFDLVSLGRFPYTNWIGKLTARDYDHIYEAMSSVGIESYANRKINEVSDGERQKAMIARTLAQDTPLIVLDEPTAFLDLPSKYDLISLLYDLTRKGKTVIYSTHDLNIAMRFSDKIWLIDQMKIHEGSPEDLVLNNTIAGTFGSGKILFNEMTGNFELDKNLTSRICLQCDHPVVEFWTRQALQRSGFMMSEKAPGLPLVTAEILEGRIKWELSQAGDTSGFTSVYDLLEALSKIQDQ